MIIAFSGTGNSFYVADLLYAEFGCKVLKLQHDALYGYNPQLGMETGDEPVIWVFPTYSWGVPPVVVNYISNIRPELMDSSVHYLVLTCGDDVGNLPGQWKKILRKKQWTMGGVWTVRMPNTYVLMKGFDIDSPDVERRKLRDCPSRVKHIAGRIKARSNEIDVLGGSWRWIKSSVIYPWFIRYAMSPKPFRADGRCISCGLCEQECPTGNITMQPDNDPAARPVWGNNCAMCLRCYHNCPAHAICYGKATAGKGQYKLSRSLEGLV